VDRRPGPGGRHPFLTIVWLQRQRARRDPGYARELKLKSAFFISWVVLALGVLFVVSMPLGWPALAALVALLWLLAQLAKRLARP